MKHSPLYLLLISVVLVASSLFFMKCSKEEYVITDKYRASFYGTCPANSTYSDSLVFEELNIPLTLHETSTGDLLINQSNTLYKTNDSLAGILTIPNADYLLHPHVFGTYSIPDGNYRISGYYAALKDSACEITGTFEIVPDL